VKKNLLFLFAALFTFSQIWAQSSNNANTQTILDILSREEPSLRELARVINLELQDCGLGAYFLLDWPGTALCGYTPLTLEEIQDKTANFMTIQKNWSSDGSRFWFPNGDSGQTGYFEVSEGLYTALYFDTSFVLIQFEVDRKLQREAWSSDNEAMAKMHEAKRKEQVKYFALQILEFVSYTFDVELGDCTNLSALPLEGYGEAACAYTDKSLDDLKITSGSLSYSGIFSPRLDEQSGVAWRTLDDGIYLEMDFRQGNDGDYYPFILRFVQNGTENNTIAFYLPAFD
jgi:hypothetical protein